MKAILFHHVGGDRYAFRSVEKWLLPEIESFAYELPGRGDRYHEPLLQQIDPIVADAFQQTRAQMQEPFFFIGLSLGGLIAWLLCHYLKAQNLPLPSFLFMASRKYPESYKGLPPVSQLPGKEFWDFLSNFGGCPPQLVAHKELLEFYEPILRADFAAAEDYIAHLSPKEPINIPTGIFYGKEDERNFTDTDARGWSPYFNNTVDYKKFPGGHFFLYEHPGAIQYIKQTVLCGG